MDVTWMIVVWVNTSVRMLAGKYGVQWDLGSDGRKHIQDGTCVKLVL